VRALHDAGVEHADLNIKNVLVTRAGKGVVIDLDQGALRDPFSDEARRANLVRLLRSAIKLHVRKGALEKRDPLRFLRAYSRGEKALRSRAREWGREALPWIRLRSLVWRVFS
jgi:RIO-like serine/threonine protein kinase